MVGNAIAAPVIEKGSSMLASAIATIIGQNPFPAWSVIGAGSWVGISAVRAVPAREEDMVSIVSAGDPRMKRR
ncbi:hypothetical protein MHEL_49160 [Mycolicibacterium helvum]|uniref:Uncharacterized protein n=1 Tax=Mycolicibacterium helvum TaxID=1534349 RepID=A0A7I7TD40_9MYCO|nr:hypothetical protein MHEL_49160 [Mycolicibacterium helvum]